MTLKKRPQVVVHIIQKKEVDLTIIMITIVTEVVLITSLIMEKLNGRLLKSNLH